MTDYTELSYLRELARNRQAEILAFKEMKDQITALALLIMEGKTNLLEVEKNLIRTIHQTETTLKTLHNGK